METSNRPTGEPEDVVSSGAHWNDPEDERPPRLFGLSRTVWSIVAVVAVMIGGVVVVQWTTRSTDSSAQESSLSGLEVNIPQPQLTATAVATSNSPTPSTSPTASTSATPTASSSSNAPRPNPTAPSQGADGSGSTRTTDANPPSGPTQTTPAEDDSQEADPPPPDNDDNDGGGEDEGDGDGGGEEQAPPVADPSANLAAGRSVQASSQVPGQGAGNVTDDRRNSYWESSPGFPQTLTVDLGEVTTVGRMVLSLPSQALWARRTQTITILGSTDGGSYSTLKGSAAYQFPGLNSENQASANFRATPVRYVQLKFTGSNGWFAAQLSDLAVHSS